MPQPEDNGELAAFDRSVSRLLDTIRNHYANVPFLALGQTVFWDEPTKAVWRRLLDRHAPGARLIAGIHDTDYFAKLPAQVQNDRKFAIVPHDDDLTRNLWSAAGELSALFGSESIPTRQMYLHNGVPFDWLTKGGPAGEATRYSGLTTAWGWRGLVRTDGQNVVACDIPAVDIAEPLCDLLDWGFDESLRCLSGDDRVSGEALVKTVRGWVEDFLENCSLSCRLSDLYESLLPRFYTLLLGDAPRDFETTTSTELFRFNTSTAAKPRFQLLDVFVSPSTRKAACAAYNQAVAGSGIYPLDNFGDGAIPFDLVVPGQGRGTIYLHANRVAAQMSPQHEIQIAASRIESVEALAAAVEEACGPNAAIVGKAVTLADMIAAEHLVLFHETASGYTSITRSFNEKLAAAGVTLNLYPIVRLTYPTWDALAGARRNPAIALPDHLANAFGSETVQAADFASSWRSIVETQRGLLAQSRALRKLRDLLAFLETYDPRRSAVAGFQALTVVNSEESTPPHPSPQAEREEESLPTPTPSPQAEREEESLPTPTPSLKGRESNPVAEPARKPWCDLLVEYERALTFLRDNARKSAVMRSRIDEHRDELRLFQNERAALETRKGDDWRANILPKMRQLAAVDGDSHLERQINRELSIRATAFDEPIAIMRERITTTKTLIASFRRQRRLLERSPEALQARAAIARITREARSAHLILVRNAFLTVEGLTHTQLRPTAWWLPLIDPSGRWFDGMVAGTSVRFEHLWPPSGGA